MGRKFLTYGTSLMAVLLFKYLGKKLSSSDEDWQEVEYNLRQAGVKWVQLVEFWGGKGGDRRTVGRFCVAVVQEVLLFGIET